MPEGGVKTSLDPKTLLAAFQPGNSMFSPGIPPTPQAQFPTRRFDFPVGVNLQWTPRSTEVYTFRSLRAFSNVELVRLAIETRKDQIERLDWQIKTKINRQPRADADERISRATKLLNRPDGDMLFHPWLRQLIEDLLAIDAACVEKRKSRSGQLIGLDVVDGSTINLLVDDTGRKPKAPNPAYEQIIKGNIWNQLSADDLFYMPRNLRPGHLYGFSPTEQVIVTINTIIQRQTQQLAHFTEGNVPAGILAVPDGYTPDQLREFKEWLDAMLAGKLGERAKLVPVPNGSKIQAIKEPPIKDDFDEWLARIICYAFSIPPTPFIKQMNRGTAQEDQDRAMEEGLGPILKWSKRLFDTVIQDELGFTDLEFSWLTERDIDGEKQARIHDFYLRNGTLSVNDVLHDLGKPSIGSDGDGHFIYTGTGAMPLERIDDAADAQIEAAKAPMTQPGGRPTPGGTKSKPAATSSSPSPQRKTPQVN